MKYIFLLLIAVIPLASAQTTEDNSKQTQKEEVEAIAADSSGKDWDYRLRLSYKYTPQKFKFKDSFGEHAQNTVSSTTTSFTMSKDKWRHTFSLSHFHFDWKKSLRRFDNEAWTFTYTPSYKLLNEFEGDAFSLTVSPFIGYGINRKNDDFMHLGLVMTAVKKLGPVYYIGSVSYATAFDRSGGHFGFESNNSSENASISNSILIPMYKNQLFLNLIHTYSHEFKTQGSQDSDVMTYGANISYYINNLSIDFGVESDWRNDFKDYVSYQVGITYSF